jgi:pimeloyl-ACP methyl ester carboxylesterase
MNVRTCRGVAAGAVVLLAGAALAGCGGASSGAQAGASSGASSGASAGAASASTSDDHLVDVGGHKLYMSCEGSGSPTIVYVHGWVNDKGYVPHDSAQGISDLLADDYRVCLYDRRNVGSSETVNSVQSPAAMRHDMEKVLENGGAKPPYILMAASFGGLVAYDYLNHHPDQVAGLGFRDRYLPRDATFRYYKHDDMCCTLERISQYLLINGLQKYIGHEPAVPMIYLASKQEPRDQNDFQSPQYDARIIKAQKAFVHRFSPGRFEWVDAPHFMEPWIPDQIAKAVRQVAALAQH